MTLPNSRISFLVRHGGDRLVQWPVKNVVRTSLFLFLSQLETSVGGPRSMHGSQEKGDGNLMT